MGRIVSSCLNYRVPGSSHLVLFAVCVAYLNLFCELSVPYIFCFSIKSVFLMVHVIYLFYLILDIKTVILVKISKMFWCAPLQVKNF